MFIILNKKVLFYSICLFILNMSELICNNEIKVKTLHELLNNTILITI